MESKAELRECVRDVKTGKFLITFAVDDMPTDDLRGELRLKVIPWKEKRSTQANALLWEMLTDIARELGSDKWTVYLQMLKRYGKCTYIVVKPKALDSLMEKWRETEVIGEYNINGQKCLQVACYYGTSSMNTAEFSKFIDSVKSEMAEMGLATPCSQDLQRAIEIYDKYHAE